jgi:hypothetical protein
MKFATIKTTIDLNVSAGTYLITCDGEIVALLPTIATTSQVKPAITPTPRQIPAQKKRAYTHGKPAGQDAFDEDILNFLKARSDRWFLTKDIGTGLGLPGYDTAARNHVGVRLKLLAREGLISKSRHSDDRLFLYRAKQGD